MKFAYKVSKHLNILKYINIICFCFSFVQFSNLMGTIYKKGNVVFTPDGNSVVSPVGNKITIYNMKKYEKTGNFYLII